jgi:hypothetical protein
MPAAFEEFDEAAWDYGDDLFEAWKEGLYNKDIYYAIGKMVMKHHVGGNPLELCSPQRGGFNVYYRLRMADSAGVMIRFPMPAYFKYAEEKLLAEVATMR